MEKNLRIQLDFGGRLGISGSSLGGLISCYAAWKRPHIYGRAGCISSSFWWNRQDMLNVILPSKVMKPTERPLIYMDSGTEGGEAGIMKDTANILTYLTKVSGYTKGVNVETFVDQGGQHSESSWGKRFHLPISFLYPISVSNLNTLSFESLQANWLQNLIKKELNGFIDGYDGKKRDLPPQCLDSAFFSHFNRNLWKFIKNTITFQNWNKLDFVN